MIVRLTALSPRTCEDCGKSSEHTYQADFSFGPQVWKIVTCASCWSRLISRMLGNDGPRL